MATYVIEHVDSESREWQSKMGGSFVSYSVNISGGDAHQGEAAELTRKPESPTPEVGEQLVDYELLPKKGTFPRKLKRMQAATGGVTTAAITGEQQAKNQAAYEAKDKSKQAEIRCSVAIKAAMALLQAEVAAGLKFDQEPASALVGPRVKFFEDLIQKAGEAA